MFPVGPGQVVYSGFIRVFHSNSCPVNKVDELIWNNVLKDKDFKLSDAAESGDNSLWVCYND